MKKLNKFFAVLVALAMMATLCVSMAFAEKPADATADISKTLSLPVGTKIPGDTYTFRFTQITNDENAISDANAQNAQEQNVATFDKTATYSEAGTVADKASYVANVEDVFAGLTFPKAGVYKYTVKEVIPEANAEAGVSVETKENAKDVVTKVTPDAQKKITTTEKTSYSEAEYVIIVGVATKDGETYVETIKAQQTKDQEGKATTGEKLDPTVGEDGKSDVNFDNEYVKSVTNDDPQDPGDDPQGTQDGQTLYIEKKVDVPTGVTAPADKDTKLFHFTVDVEVPAGTQTDVEYKVVKANGTVPETATKVTLANNKGQIIEDLANGDRIVLTNVPFGTTYEVTEDDYPAYDEAISYNVESKIVTDGAKNASIATNTYNKDKDPATGLSIANLPFIVLALVAVGGLVAYVVVRRKSEDNA